MSYIRLHVTAEGQTEKNFVKRVLEKHLAEYSVFTDCRCVLTSKDNRTGKEYRGGFRRTAAYTTVKRDIQTWHKEDRNPECRFTIMFDYYALPKDFPGMELIKNITDPYEKIRILENALKTDIGDNRFIPYIQLHEFETLIFVKPEMLETEYFDSSDAIEKLKHDLLSVKDQNPELINDNYETAPSKRIEAVIPDYDKANIGPEIVALIGIKKLQESCKHFNSWLEILENLAIDN